MLSRRSASTVIVAMFLSLACGGGDGGTDPTSGLNFPPLDAAVNAQYCVRGNATVGQNKSGNVTVQDCDYADLGLGGGGYYEVWRVRVATAATVTFSVDAPNFDSYLDVFQIDIVAGDVETITPLGSDDDTNGDDPQLSLDLVPDTDYAIVISGFDYPEVGSYTVAID